MALSENYDIDQLLEEFRKIGRDSAYYPESEGMTAEMYVPKNEVEFSKERISSVQAHWFALMQGLSQRATSVTYRQPVREGCWICTFCRKNGEAHSYYQSHRLRDELNRICCPILRNYVCPICHATGDNAHTLKYCPFNKESQSIPLISRLKGLRNSMGKRNGRLGY